MSKEIKIPKFDIEPIIADDGTVFLTAKEVNEKVASLVKQAQENCEKFDDFFNFKIDFEKNYRDSVLYVYSHHLYSRFPVYMGSGYQQVNKQLLFHELKHYFKVKNPNFETPAHTLLEFEKYKGFDIHIEELFFPMEVYEKCNIDTTYFLENQNPK